MTDYTKRIKHVHSYQGEVFPSATIDPDDSTLKDQILVLLNLADERYAEVLAGVDIEGNDPCYLLVDAVKILEGVISNLEASDLWTEKYGEIE